MSQCTQDGDPGELSFPEISGRVTRFPTSRSAVFPLARLVDEGNSARQVVGDSNAPLRSIIVGVIDRIDAEA